MTAGNGACVVGIDEAGRGPLAGPVSVGVVVLLPGFDQTLLLGIKDSKQLTEKARERWFALGQEWVSAGLIRATVVYKEAHEIDERGIAVVIREAVGEGLAVVAPESEVARVLLDGALRAPSVYADQTTIIHGDAIEPVISLASVFAKVARDHLMVELDTKYPGYGLAKHKGYGTAAHYAALKELGPSVIHRRSFL